MRWRYWTTTRPARLYAAVRLSDGRELQVRHDHRTGERRWTIDWHQVGPGAVNDLLSPQLLACLDRRTTHYQETEPERRPEPVSIYPSRDMEEYLQDKFGDLVY